MNLPVGEWLLFSLGILAFVEWDTFRVEPYLKFLPLIWFVGWMFELLFMMDPRTFYWHFSRVFVMVAFFIIAWRRIQHHEILPLLFTSIVFLGHNLLVVNEPGIYEYEQWIVGFLILLLSYLSADNLWGMALAVTGGMLINLGFSIFLFSGIVRRLYLPDPFFWHFCIAGLVAMAVFTQLKNYLRMKYNSLK